MSVLADDKQVARLIETLARAVERDVVKVMKGPWAIVGIKSRGDLLAQRLAAILKPQHTGSLDITLYRDDLSEIGAQPVVRTTEIPFAIDGLSIVLVDDVLMTGRSIRAALQSLMDLGRPRRVWLSVLVDRGGRELPIAPDHVAMDLTKKKLGNQRVEVLLKPTDDRDAIVVRAPASRSED